MSSTADIVSLLADANAAYRAGAPVMSDADYDRNVEHLRQIDPGNAFLHAVEPEASERSRVRLVHPMLSMEKAYSFDDVQRFVRRCESAAREIGLERVKLCISPKMDGMAGYFDGQRLFSRGDGEHGFDITDAIGKGLTGAWSGAGPGEIVVDIDYFSEHLSGAYAHPRSFVAGAILADELTDEAEAAFQAGAVHFFHFSNLRGLFGRKLDSRDLTSDNLRAVSAKFRFAVDGLVIEAVDPELKQHMGATAHHHRWQVAFKTLGETADSVVRSISWQVSRRGVVTPVAEIDPVVVSGATIRRVTCHNAEYVQANGIGAGAVVRIVRAGEVVPKIHSVITSAETDVPEECPECGWDLHWQGPALVCSAPVCAAQRVGTLQHFLQTMEVKGFGPNAVDKLRNVPLERILDLRMPDFLGRGFGEKTARNMERAILARLSTPLAPYRLLAALGISNLGESMARKILQCMTLDELLAADVDTLCDIPSIGDFYAVYLTSQLHSRKGLIERLRSLLVLEEPARAVAGTLAGSSFVFTGKMQAGSRKECEALAAGHGAAVQKSVTSATTHLVCGENVGKAKKDRAAKVGAAVLDEAAFLALVGR